MNRNALISADEKYRYWLSRGFFSGSKTDYVLFVMLNPSTADAVIDDPTIKRCIGFARSWGRPGLVVANLYAYRATKPSDLWKSTDPEGWQNDMYLARLMLNSSLIVCAWGANAKLQRVERFKKMASELDVILYCLGTTKNGSPKHPLYIKAAQELQVWDHEN